MDVELFRLVSSSSRVPREGTAYHDTFTASESAWIGRGRGICCFSLHVITLHLDRTASDAILRMHSPTNLEPLALKPATSELPPLHAADRFDAKVPIAPQLLL